MNDDVAKLLMARPGMTQDHNYVIRTWAWGYRDSPIAADLGAQFLDSWSRIAHGWLLKPDTSLHVLALKNEPKMIVAFAVLSSVQTESPTIHWVYTQKEWRGKGLAHELLEPILKDKKIQYSHRTPKVSVLPEWKYVSPVPPP